MRLEPELVLAPAYTAFPLAKADLDACAARIRGLYPVVPRVAKVRVCDPGTGITVAELRDGGTLRLATLPAGATLVADPDALPCVVTFGWDGMTVRTEGTPPHCISGDAGPASLTPWAGLTVGEHVLTVTPFDRAGGTAGEPAVYRFAVTADRTQPPPNTTPAEPTSDDPAGWTPLPLAPGAREIYVRADGDDGNAGDTPTRPVRSLAKAMSLLRPAGGDRIRLFAGHTFDGGLGRWRASGLPESPAGVMAYGDSADRPVINVRKGSGVLFDAPGVHDVAFVGLRFTAPERDPASPAFVQKPVSYDDPSAARCGLEATRAVAGLLIEDCQFDHFPYNVNLITLRLPERHSRVVVRRCLLLDAWALAEDAFKGHGLFAENVADLRIVESSLDHNGWLDGAPGGIAGRRTQYRHAVYASAYDMGPVTFEGNVCSNNANCGAQIRLGGVVRGNLFVDNGVSALLSGEDAEFADNVVVGGHDTIEYGLGIGVSASARSSRVLRNVLIDRDGRSGQYPAARIHVDRRDWTAAGPRDVTVSGNVVAGCDGAAVRVGDALATLTLVDNDFQSVGRQVVALDRPVEKWVSRENTCAAAAGSVYFTHHATKDKKLTLAEWLAATGGTAGTGEAPFADRPAAFADSSWQPDTSAIVAALRRRQRGSWESRWSATATISAAQSAYGRSR